MELCRAPGCGTKLPRSRYSNNWKNRGGSNHYIIKPSPGGGTLVGYSSWENLSHRHSCASCFGLCRKRLCAYSGHIRFEPSSNSGNFNPLFCVIGSNHSKPRM